MWNKKAGNPRDMIESAIKDLTSRFAIFNGIHVTNRFRFPVGTDMFTGTQAGTGWVEGANLHIIDENEVEQTIPSSSGVSLTIAETEVFSGTSPSTWTDLDLSGTVGANVALVLLKASSGDTAGQNITNLAVRQNGDTEITYLATTAGCSIVTYTSHNQWEYVLCITDASGVIEWITNIGRPNVTIDVVAYIK